MKNVMRILKNGGNYLSDADYRFLLHASRFHAYDHLPDEEYVKRTYRAALGKEPDLVHPRTFNEKLQWLKLHDRRPEYTTMVDKCRVKEYVAARIGQEYIIPTLGVWEHPDDIDFDALPDKFVLKCNHNSGLGMYICRDRSQLNAAKVKRILQKGLRQDYYLTGREWPYKDVPRKILAEPYLSDGTGDLTDYKVHNFGGVPKCILVCKDRFAPSGLTEDFFSPDWQPMEVKRPGHPRSAELIARPPELETVLALSAKLAQHIPFVRTDFYIVNHRVYFSELTFYPASGFEAYDPPEWDEVFGSWLELPR